MTARIFKPSRSSTQSGLAKTKEWVLEFAPKNKPDIDPIMGWSGSGDLYPAQVRLLFNSMDEAVKYAENSGLEFTVTPPQQAAKRIKSYVNMYKKAI